MAELVEAAEAKLPRQMRDGVLDPNGYYAGTRRDLVEAAEHGPIIKDGLANLPFGEHLSGLTVHPVAAPVVAGPPDPERRQQAMDRMGAASKRLAELQRTDPSICRSYRDGQAPPKSSAVIEVEQELCDAMREFIAADPTYPGLSMIKDSLDDMQRRSDEAAAGAVSASPTTPVTASTIITPELLAAGAKFGVFYSIAKDVAAEQGAGAAAGQSPSKPADNAAVVNQRVATTDGPYTGPFGSIMNEIMQKQAAAASAAPNSERGADAIAASMVAGQSTADLLPSGKDETSGVEQLQAMLRSGDQPRVSAVSSLLPDFPAERVAMMAAMRGHVGPKFIASLAKMGGSATTAVAAPTSVISLKFNDATPAQRAHQSPAASDPQPPVMPQSKPRNVTLTAPVQMKADVADSAISAADVREAAALGTVGSGHTLPFIDQLQKAFGRDLTGIKAHTDSTAAAGAAAMGAKAYATGNNVVFGENPDLHTVAHEVAHVLQQQAGVHLSSGIGAAGDDYERAADAIADRVVAGQSAADLLPGGEATASGLQQ